MARTYPEHPRPSCHALMVQDGAVCLIQRAAEPFKGYWGMPGGAVELGETVTGALRREVLEETGLTVEVERFLGFRDAIERDDDGRVRFHFVIFYYLVRPTGGSLCAADDAAAAAWVPLGELDRYQVTDSVRQCLAWADGGVSPAPLGVECLRAGDVRGHRDRAGGRNLPDLPGGPDQGAGGLPARRERGRN